MENKTKKITFLQNISALKAAYRIGQTEELPEVEAAEFLKAGYAEDVTTAPGEVPEVVKAPAKKVVVPKE